MILPRVPLLARVQLLQVYPLGDLKAGDFIYFTVGNAGDGVDNDDTRIRFRIKAVVKAGGGRERERGMYMYIYICAYPNLRIQINTYNCIQMYMYM